MAANSAPTYRGECSACISEISLSAQSASEVALRVPDPRSFLSIPSVYTSFQRFVRGKGEAVYVERQVRPEAGNRILDIGCGTGDILRYMPDVHYVGFDSNPRVVEVARKRYGDRGAFFCEKVTHEALGESEPFDIVLATGVLHHLDDREAVELLEFADNALKPGHRLVTLDGCYAAGQSAVARFVVTLDRGKFVRTADEYIRLASKVFKNVRATIDHGLTRIPTTVVMMECSN
jgi:SAM-dependent methyltransferase